ncbi:signal peptidase I [uncultured Bacteroides sp.]|uniref:signal peptidase I n=1 Tax=uncultured Bacteroides sp. TaxID=162156 RepID=UPI00260137EF|nr:signal peptidase I [uncultured Bacteroides sp.]
MNNPSLFRKIFDWGINLFLCLCGMGLAWLVIQVFFVTSFHIPSDSMEPELLAGDAILVNKVKYGARLFDVMDAVDGKQVEIKRLPGWGRVERNDVVVFNYPCPKKWRRIEMDVMQYYVKRCVALPGDTFRIVNGRYRVDGCPHDLGNVEAQDRFRALIEERGLSDEDKGVKAYPGGTQRWTVRDFGPLYIPKAGDRIRLDSTVFRLYRNVMEWELKEKLRCKDNRVYIGDRVLTEYRFTKNYYFMAGDKVENSKDSRYWGLLPEEYIVGKAWRVWKSVDEHKGKTRWERIWKKIR